uniref:NADH-ubiquinone oxidoreductase chain 2 n=1 Tax=Ornebius kanetataki TaxID=1980616 RepID=A0A385I219_9ORTH|nr:NADH dehydrogenase subunit 2 [Ornebius kanetataki]AXY63950.1 NADH dehydrogenase subunit 2 [Ornebius kanetataki]
MAYNNPSKFLFLILLLIGTMMTISANSWLATWMGLEINLLSFIPLISDSMNIFSTEAALYYFIIQAIASSLLLFLIIISFILEKNLVNIQSIFYVFISTTLFMKLGACPFHYWFPKVMEGLTWMNCFILMTWQKLAPFFILTLIFKNFIWFNLISFSSIIIGSIGGINQTSLRKILAYSSINHIGWMILALQFNNSIWLIYFSIYFLINFSLTLLLFTNQISHINQFLSFNSSNNNLYNFFISMNFLSLSGLPPFLGFFPKWMIIESLQSIWYINFLLTMMIVTSILTLYYYLQISIKIFLFSSSSNKWLFILHPTNSIMMSLLTNLSSFSILGLPCFILFFNFI